MCAHACVYGTAPAPPPQVSDRQSWWRGRGGCTINPWQFTMQKCSSIFSTSSSNPEGQVWGLPGFAKAKPTQIGGLWALSNFQLDLLAGWDYPGDIFPAAAAGKGPCSSQPRSVLPPLTHSEVHQGISARGFALSDNQGSSTGVSSSRAGPPFPTKPSLGLWLPPGFVDEAQSSSQISLATWEGQIRCDPTAGLPAPVTLLLPSLLGGQARRRP